MPYPNSPIALATNQALSVGDNVLDPGAMSLLPQGDSPALLMLSVRTSAFTTGPVVVRVEYSPDGTNWGLADPTQVMSNITGTGVVSKRFDVQFPRWRIVAALTAGAATISVVAFTTNT